MQCCHIAGVYSAKSWQVSPLWYFTEHFGFLEIKFFSQNLHLGVHLGNTIPTIQQATTGSAFPKTENTISGLQGQM